MRTTLATVIVGSLIASALVPLASAGEFGPFHAQAYVVRAGDLPTRTYLVVGYLGIGGYDDPDCQDFDDEIPLRYTTRWDDNPPMAIKGAAQETTLLEEGVEMAAPQEVEMVCDTIGETTSDPQMIGFGELGIRSEDVWFPVAFFDTNLFSVSATIVSCRVAQTASSPQFASDANRGAAELETLIPSESLAGSSLEGLCKDHTPLLDQQWTAGGINRNGGSLDDEIPYSSAIPERDMPPGMWAVCVTGLLQDTLSGTQYTETDYTWWWVEDTNMGYATQWADPGHWDGEDWREGFTSQQPCDTLGTFAV